MSGNNSQLVVSLGLNSTDFQKKIKVINQKMKEFESEFKSAESAMSKFGDQQKKLSEKMNMLKSKFEMSEQKVKEYRKELEKVEGTVKKQKAAYDKLDNKLQEQRQELEKLEKTVGKNSTRYKELQQEIKDTEDGLRRKANAVAEAEARLSRHNTALNNAQKEYNDLQREIRETQNALKNFKLDQMAQNFDKIGNAAKSFGGNLRSLGNSLTVGVTTPIVGFGTLAAKTFFDFEQQVRRVNAISSSETMNMGQRFDYLSEQTRKFGRETEWTALEVGQAYEYFAMAGKSVEEATESMGPMLNLASIGMLDLGTAADIVTDTMTPFSKELTSLSEKAKKSGKDFNEAEWMIDRFAATITNSNTNISLMGETMKYAAPTVASLGGDFEDLAVAVGAMANAGIKGSMAGTSLSTGLNRLVKPAKEGAKAMKQYGIELKKTKDGEVDLMGTMEQLRKKLGELDEVERGRAVTAIFGQTAQKGWLSIINAEEREWNKLKKAIENADGATEEMMEEMKKSGAYGFKVMQSAISDLLIVVGDALAPALVSVGEKITDMAIKISNWVTKMHETNPQMLEMIGKLALFAVAAGPVLSVLGLMTQGFGTIVGGIGKGIGAFTKFSGKLAETAATAAAGTSKFSIFASTIGVSGPVLIGAAVAALVGLAASIGENENALAWLIDKWGVFGTVVGGVCEFIAGVVQMSLGNLLIIIGGIGKAIVAFVSGKWREIDDIMRETGADIQMNNKKAWSNIKMESTRALTDIRTMTERDMEGIKGAFEGALRTLPKLTRDNLDQAGTEFANLFKSANGNMLDLSDSTIKILRGTSDTMATLFSGIKGNMDLEEARVKFTYNMSDLLNSGKISLEDLQSEFKSAGDLIAANMANSFERVKKETGEILGELGDIARDGLEPVAADITSIIDGMSTETVKTIRTMGSNWGTLFKGIKTDGSSTTQQMKDQILKNMEELGLNTPEKLEKFKSALLDELDAAKTAAKEKGNEIGSEIPDSVAEGTETTTDSAKKTVKENTKKVAEGAKEGMTEGLATIPQAVHDELAKAGVSINAQGQVIVEDMAKKGGDAGKAYVNTLNNELPQLSGVSGKIQKQLAGIDSVRLGNVTKQLSEVNRWLGVVQQKAQGTREGLVRLTNLPFGNTTKGLSETNKWLGNVSRSSKTTADGLRAITKLSFTANTTQLNNVKSSLDKVTSAAKLAQNSLKGMVAVTYGSTTKGLSEVNKWLGSVRSSANTAKTALQNMAAVKFGGLTKSLSEVNRWLGTVKSSASGAKTAVTGVSRARSIEVPVENIPTTFMPRVDLSQYQMTYNKRTMPDFSPKVELNTPPQDMGNNNNSELLSILADLVKAISSQQINVGVNMNGKTLATATAPFMKAEIDKIDRRRNRLAGI